MTDPNLEALLSRSSLGAEGFIELAARTDHSTVDEILRRKAALTTPPVPPTTSEASSPRTAAAAGSDLDAYLTALLEEAAPLPRPVAVLDPSDQSGPTGPPTALVAAAAAGDERAWNEMVSRYTHLLWSVARSYRLDRADAADVVQTAWLRLLEHLDSIQDPARLVGWLVTTTRRESLRKLRRAGFDRAAADDERLDDVEPAVPGGLSGERAIEIWKAYRKLPEHCQRLLRIAVAIPREHHDVAADLEVPTGYIGPTRARCLDYLRKLLAGAGWTDTH
jgi:RNA polymerase sigma factor (sigma-70 family)